MITGTEMNAAMVIDVTLTITRTIIIAAPAFFVGWASVCNLDPLLSDWVLHANKKIVIGVRLNDDPSDARGLLQTQLECHIIAVHHHPGPASLWLFRIYEVMNIIP
jgi:hypothetical protein